MLIGFFIAFREGGDIQRAGKGRRTEGTVQAVQSSDKTRQDMSFRSVAFDGVDLRLGQQRSSNYIAFSTVVSSRGVLALPT